MSQPTAPKPVTVTVELDDTTALALAKFLKLSGWSVVLVCSDNNEEADEMNKGMDALQRALADAGYAPR